MYKVTINNKSSIEFGSITSCFYYIEDYCNGCGLKLGIGNIHRKSENELIIKAYSDYLNLEFTISYS